MSNDRELLELAAKACGYDIGHSWNALRLTFEPPVFSLCIPGVSTGWNPLSEDGHALRLAAKLKIDLEWQHDEEAVEAYVRSFEGSTYCPSYPAIEYKRAIVDVAAEIGRQMP